jgi:hypothetical protein
MNDKTKEQLDDVLTEEQEEQIHEDLFEEMFGSGERDRVQELGEEVEREDAGEEAGEQGHDENDLRERSSRQASASEKEDDQKTDEGVREEGVIDDPYAWIATLDSDFKDKAEALKHRALSDRGRVAGLNKKVTELQAKFDAAQVERVRTEQARASSTSTSAKTQTEVPDAVKNLQKEYPELAQQIQSLVDYEKAQTQEELRREFAPIRQSLTEQQLRDERTKLAAAAAQLFDTDNTGIDYQEVLRSDDWKTWLYSQPKFLQDAAMKARTAEDSMYILNKFVDDIARDYDKEHREQQEKELEGKRSVGQQVKDKRQATLKKNVTPASKGVGTSSSRLTGDYEEMFNALWGGSKKK